MYNFIHITLKNIDQNKILFEISHQQNFFQKVFRPPLTVFDLEFFNYLQYLYGILK